LTLQHLGQGLTAGGVFAELHDLPEDSVQLAGVETLQAGTHRRRLQKRIASETNGAPLQPQVLNGLQQQRRQDGVAGGLISIGLAEGIGVKTGHGISAVM
jgi:hypothetical protein